MQTRALQKSLPQQKIVIAWQRVVTLRFTPSLLATIAKKPVTVSGRSNEARQAFAFGMLSTTLWNCRHKGGCRVL